MHADKNGLVGSSATFTPARLLLILYAEAKRRYIYLVRVKTSVTLPDTLLTEIDRVDSNRSAFLEKAARKYLADEARALRRKKDAAILERISERLNREAEDVLEYQSFPG